MRKFFVRTTRRTWNIRSFLAAFLLLAVGLGVFFPSIRSSAAASNPQVLAEDQWLMSVYQKGKDCYERGNYQGAVAEWDKLNGILDRYPAFKTVVDYLRGRAKSISPDEMNQVDQKLAERKRQLDSIFQKGKEFYDKGNFEQAIGEWDKLGAYLPEEAPDRRVFADFKKYYAESLKARPVKQSLPTLTLEESGEMRNFFEAASQKFKKKSEQAKSSAESPEIQTQNPIKDSFEKSKSLYFQGNYQGAIEELEKISVYFVQNSPERRSIEKMALAYHESLDAQKEAEKSIEKKNLKYRVPQDSLSFVAQANEKFLAQIKEFEAERLAVEKTAADRQSWALEDFQKGRKYFEEGKYDEAILEWEKVAGRSENETDLHRLIDEVKQNKDMLQQVKQSGAQAAAEKQKFLQTSVIEPLRQSLQQFLEKLKTQRAVLESEKQKAEKTLFDQQASFSASFEKGQLLYESGRFDEAKKEWSTIGPKMENPAGFQEFMEGMDRLQEETLKIRKAREQVAGGSSIKFKAPAELARVLEEVSQKVKADGVKALEEKQKADQAFADRQALSNKIFANGKNLYEAGKLPDAIKEWSDMLPYLEEESQLKETLQSLNAGYENSLKTRQSAKEAQAKKDSKLPTPEVFAKLLNDIRSQIQTQTESAQARKTNAEQGVIDKQAFVSGGFQKGKTFFDEYKFENGLKEWSSILSNLEEESKLKPLLDQAVQENQNLILAQKAAENAEGRKDSKLSAPEELEKLLTVQIQKLKQMTDASNEQGRKAEKHLADRQNIINNTFDEGKILFKEGKFSEAVKVWQALTPELEDGEKLKDQMQALGVVYQESIAAQKSAEDAEIKKDAKLLTPFELSKLLAELSLKIQSQIESAMSQKQTADKELSDKQVKLDAIFAKGKLAVDQGKLPDAIKEWSDMLPYLEEESQLKETLQSLNAGYENSLKTRQSAKEAQAKKDSKLPTPIELVKIMSDISAQAKIQTQLADDQKKKAEQVLEDRTTLINNTYLKGKTFFDAGKFEEALKEWSSILSHLEERLKLKPVLEDVGQDVQNLSMARRAAQDAEQKRDAKLKAPTDLANLLAKSGAKLKVQIVEAQNQKKKNEEYLAERQRQIDETIQQGNAYFEQGKWDEAKNTWLSAQPFLEDTQSFQNTIIELEKIHEERQEVQKTLDQAGDWMNVKFKIPADISKELIDSRDRLLEQIKEADVAKQKAEQRLAQRQTEIQQAFDEGKAFYWEGKVAEAIQQWASIAPYLENSDIKKSVQAVTESYERLLKLQQDAQSADLRKDDKLKTPEELPKLLSDARQIIDSQTQYAETQKKLADQTFVDRQSLINSTFQKGKILYEQDRIPEALEEWAAITSYLEKGSQLQAFIDNVAKNYENSQVVKKVAEEAELKKTIKFQTPEDLSRLLNEAGQKLNAQTEESKMKKEIAEQTRAARQAFINSNFQRGKILYEKGDISSAVDAWTALIPYIEDDAKIRQLILKVEENHRALEEAKSAAAQTLLPEQKKVILPDDFEKILNESNQKLEKKTGEKNQAKLEADVRQVIQNKKTTSRKAADKKAALAKQNSAIPMDEIERMMIEYNVSTPAEIERRHQELKAIK